MARLTALGIALPALDTKLDKIKERLSRGEYPLLDQIECQTCEGPATISDEPPPRTATANDWWCDAHVPPAPPPGWKQVDLLRWAEHAGLRFTRLVRKPTSR